MRPLLSEKLVVINGHIIGERAKRARHYQWCTNSRFAIYMYIYIWMYVRHNISAGTY